MYDEYSITCYYGHRLLNIGITKIQKNGREIGSDIVDSVPSILKKLTKDESGIPASITKNANTRDISHYIYIIIQFWETIPCISIQSISRYQSVIS